MQDLALAYLDRLRPGDELALRGEPERVVYAGTIWTVHVLRFPASAARKPRAC